VPAVDEPLRRLRNAAGRPAPAVGFERPPRRLLVALRAATAEAAAGAATLALLEAAPRTCDGLLAELVERERSVDMGVRDVLAVRSSRIDPTLCAALTEALADIAHSVHDAGAWSCRSARCEPELQGCIAALRDATRDLSAALAVFPAADSAVAAVGVHRRVSEGRRLARRARAVAIETRELREVLSRMAAIAAVERALRSAGRAASTVQRLALS
jgi:hypothetical protein